jgi:hypothetical protein
MAICLVVAMSSTLLVALPDRITLAWDHTVEKIRWEEDYVATRDGLLLTEARIKGTGAGMEMPPDATLANGRWHYRPNLAPLPEIFIRNSELPRGYEVCREGRCSPLRALIGPDDRLLALTSCNKEDGLDRGQAPPQ